MVKITNVYAREYQSGGDKFTAYSMKDDKDKEFTSYNFSKEDTIQKELEEECIAVGPNRDLNNNYFNFEWHHENGAFTRIEIDKPRSLVRKPSYNVVIKLQTMNSNQHPQGLLEILQRNEFQEQPKNP